MEIEFFKTGNKSPAEDFLDSLQKNERAKVLRVVRLLEDFGLDLDGSYIESLGEGLFALRTIFACVFIRMLFFTVAGNKCVILCGFKKKTNKIPAKEIKTAKERRKEYLNML
jgi:phage-related protein